MPRQASLTSLCTLLVLGACQPDEGGDAPSESNEEVVQQTPEESAEDGTPPADEGAAPINPVVAEAEALADSLQARQLAMAADLRAAIDAQDAAATGSSLVEIGRNLAEMRGANFDGALVEAVRWFAAAEMVDLRSSVDARRVIPALEVLLDVRDGAAVHRLRDSYGTGPAAERFQAAFSLSLSWTNAASNLTFGEVACPLLIDAEPAGDSPVALTYGSHTIGCEGGAVFLFVAHTMAHRLTLQAGELQVQP